MELIRGYFRNSVLVKENIIIVALVILSIVYITNFAIANVVGSSMFPTYNEDDSLLIVKSTNISRGDTVVVWSTKLNEYIIKRVIGVSGDFVSIEDNKVYVNNNLLEEDYINEPMEGNLDTHLIVDDNEIFVMGDNRNLSLDSRVLGSFPLSQVKGVVIVDLTKTFHYSYKNLITLFRILWGIFCVAVVISVISSYIKKWKVKH